MNKETIKQKQTQNVENQLVVVKGDGYREMGTMDEGKWEVQSLIE